MHEGNHLARAGSVVQIACQCGRSACAEVLALPRCLYEQAQAEPCRLLLAPGHELPGIRPALSRFDSFVVVWKEEPERPSSPTT